MQLLVLKMYKLSPGITELSSRMQQSQTLWWKAALHANFKLCLSLKGSNCSPLYMRSLRVMTSSSNQPKCLFLLSFSVMFRLHNAGVPSVILLLLSAIAPLSFPGLGSPGHLLLPFVIAASASRGHHHHIFVLKFDRDLNCFECFSTVSWV